MEACFRVLLLLDPCSIYFTHIKKYNYQYGTKNIIILLNLFRSIKHILEQLQKNGLWGYSANISIARETVVQTLLQI